MEVGERYIIEISDVIATNNGNLAKIKGFNALVFDANGLNKLEQITSDVRLMPSAILKQIKDKERREGYSVGYDEGFKDGVKHQENMMPPKEEHHEPQAGDIYRIKPRGDEKIIITYDPVLEGERYTALLPNGDYQTYDAEELKMHFEFVENRADLLEPIKGALA